MSLAGDELYVVVVVVDSAQRIEVVYGPYISYEDAMAVCNELLTRGEAETIVNIHILEQREPDPAYYAPAASTATYCGCDSCTQKAAGHYFNERAGRWVCNECGNEKPF